MKLFGSKASALRCVLLLVSLAAIIGPLSVANAGGLRGAADPPAAKAPEALSSEIALVPAAPTAPAVGGKVAAGGSFREIEPNDTSATAQPLVGTEIKLKGNMQPSTPNDLDWYSFTAAAGDRLYAATQTQFSSGGSGLTGDSTLEVFAADGTTLLETDNDDGSFASTSASIAGLTLVTGGPYFIKVRHSSASPASEIHPYDLYLRLQSGSPTAESEPNNNGGTPNPVPASGWVSGTIDPAGPPIDNDTYSIALNAGDTVFISLDADPERDATTFNPRLGFGLFDNFFLLADGSAAVTPNSEAFFMSVRDAGTYVIYVDTAVAGAGPTATYQLSVSVHPQDAVRSYTAYLSTDVPKTIGPAAGLVTSTITVPGTPTVGNLRVGLNITFDTSGSPAVAQLGQLDISLVAPEGNEVVLVDDPPAAANGTTAPQIDYTLDDEAGLPTALFAINKPMLMQPESLGRLYWFKNQNAGGTWTLNVRDDLTDTLGGTLNGWSISVGTDPVPAACAGTTTSVLNQDFESTDGGFTHSGTADEWEYGTPAFAPITTAHSGTKAWKTDLDNTYNNAPTGGRVDQELVSPTVDLSTYAGQTIGFEWAMKYQIEGAHWDRAYVEVRQVGNPSHVKRYFEHRGPTMTRTVGSPGVVINSAAGWGVWKADISEFAGQMVTLAFHLDEDDSVVFAGLAIDDVKVTACSTPPTAASLRSFTAKSAPSKAVRLSWKMASELGVAGYNVYGETRGNRVKLNRQLIAGNRAVLGGTYRFTYRPAKAVRPFARYWLQGVNTSGARAWYGQASIR